MTEYLDAELARGLDKIVKALNGEPEECPPHEPTDPRFGPGLRIEASCRLCHARLVARIQWEYLDD